MGRYYSSHHEIISLYLTYLEDINTYNSYIKEICQLLLNKNEHQTKEEMQHKFLFVIEAQKTSDQLYEFYHNRYFFNSVRNFIYLPTFLSVDVDEFKDLKKSIKKINKKLVESTQHNISQTISKICITETSINYNDKYDRLSVMKTMKTEQNEKVDKDKSCVIS